MTRLKYPATPEIDCTHVIMAHGLCLVSPQEAEELHAFAQPALHHLPAAQHLAHDLPDLPGAEVEAFVEPLHAGEDLLLGQVRIADRRQLPAMIVDEIDCVILLQPAIVDGL